MALKFGTSGVRGLVTEMTDEECFLYTTAFVRYLKSRTPLDTVALSGDFRSSTPRILRAVAAAIEQEGINLDFAGFMPTPAVVAYAMARDWASIMVTGSHIPDDRNGIKFNMPWGEVLKTDEARISALHDELKAAGHTQTVPPVDLGPANPAVEQEFMARFTDYFPPNALAGKKIVVYQHSAVIRDMLPEMLSRLGAEVVTVGRSDTFVPVDTEAVANPGQLASWVSEHDADALVSADGDSDRPLVVDESGKVVRGDVLGVLTASYLEADSVSAPVSCNTALEKCGSFASVNRTRIGSPYVIEAMNEAKKGSFERIMGYEANGGFLTATNLRRLDPEKILTALPTRDCALPILAVLHAAASRGLSLSTLVGKLPPRFTCSGLIREFPTKISKEIVGRFRNLENDMVPLFVEPTFGPVETWDFTDGVRMTFAFGDIVHLRPSGNAPEFRIYTEADDENRAALINDMARAIVRDGVRPAIEDELSATATQQLANVVAMNTAPAAGTGMDVVIVSTTSRRDEEYWQARLDAMRGQICKSSAITLAVHEDWTGGAGNGLGTLYSVLQARSKCGRLYGIDLLEILSAGAAVGLYHTAGKGTRLAPLPASEGNNKPAVQLPGLLDIDGRTEALTILEATIKQTAIYAPSRKGRLSVFWGDQVFVPSKSASYTPTHHADIMVKLRTSRDEVRALPDQLLPLPDAAAWEREGLDRYGLIAIDSNNNAAQVEKVDHATAKNLVKSGVIGVDNGLGVSIGSFSMSAEMVMLLLDEFAPELFAREGKMDTDPHFWMPLTLDKKTYLAIMAGKGEDVDAATEHYDRMDRFKKRFSPIARQRGLFGAVDVGADCYWWDYGTLENFRTNLLKLVGTDAEAKAARTFFGINDRRVGSAVGDGVDADDSSCLLGSRVKTGKVRRSVLVGVSADNLDVEDSVLVGTASSSLEAQECLLYKVSADGQLAPRTVRAGVSLSNGRTVAMQTSLDRDGKADWSRRLPGNPYSYAELHETIGSEREKSKKAVL